ncbi:NAD-dependent epimerase/dehydratase family protein [Singulisphaera sp. PoT]|uniref:NAD-dependent epimerase/dehydratase family protein n=1 Tax=Singulisphaera sp. PoT TaxID=3411797 RepID=UPI003BF54C73
MATLITGVEGFLGARVAQLLHSEGSQVVGLDVVAASAPRPWPVIVGDVTDKALVDDIFARHGINNVVHAGGVSGPHICNNQPARVFEVNVLGTLNLFEAARTTGLKGRVVFLSSSSVYGQAAEEASRITPVVERLPLLASEPYGSSKVSCEAMVRAYAHQDKVDLLSLRVSIVYGAGRTAYCGITQLLKTALAGEPIVLDQGCDVPLPWIYITDLCEVVKTALQIPKDRIREVDTLAYNVTGPGFPTFREIACIIQELVPGTVVQDGPDPDKYAMNARKMSLASIHRDLGWEPKVEIREGVGKLHEWLAR